MINNLLPESSKITISKLLTNKNTASWIVFIAVLASFLISIITIFRVNNPYENGWKELWNNLWVEGVGIIFDALLLVVLLTYLDSQGEKSREIKRYHEEIDDYRGWREPEATYRILGNIRRLQRLNVKKINLNSCSLQNQSLEGMDLKESDLSYANLSASHFYA